MLCRKTFTYSVADVASATQVKVYDRVIPVPEPYCSTGRWTGLLFATDVKLWKTQAK